MGLLVIQTVNTHIMKFLLLVSALSLASGTKLGAVTCDECKAASQGLVERLTTDASIEEQAGILIATLCPQAPDAAACEAGVTQWWGDIANCLYPAFLGTDDACIRLGYCTIKTEPKDWTCEDCTTTIDRVGAYMQEQETIDAGITFLQGDCFCGAGGHTDDCPDLVSQLIPGVMPVLAGVLTDTSTELCQDVVGVC